jgi:hypothetical protein
MNTPSEATSILENLTAKILSKYRTKRAIHYLLRSFLPLDIDIQALESISIEEKRKYMEEMFVDKGNYLQKILDFQYLVNGQDNGVSREAKAIFHGQNPLAQREGLDKECLLMLSGIENPHVLRFFEMLDKKEDTPEKILGYVFYEDIKSFHEWYIAVDRCLKGFK